MSDFKTRLVEEHATVKGNLEKLRSFINSDLFSGLDKVNKGALVVQSALMTRTVNVLKRRINILSNINYESVIEFSFGEAIELIKGGYKVARIGWNGNGMFIYHIPAAVYKSTTNVAKAEFGDEVAYHEYIALATVDGSVATWSPSTSDALSTDWFIVD